MKCVISGVETDNKWNGIPICKDEIELAQLERDEMNKKLISDHRKSMTCFTIKNFGPKLTTTRQILAARSEEKQKSLAKKLAAAMKKAKGEKTKVNKFI